MLIESDVYYRKYIFELGNIVLNDIQLLNVYLLHDMVLIGHFKITAENERNKIISEAMWIIYC